MTVLAGRPGWTVEVAALVRRNLIHMRRRPQLLLFAIIEPVALVLMFRYVFGGAVGMSTTQSYPDFVLPGILVQTITLGSVTVGASVAQDLHRGLTDRFRSMPIGRLSVVASHAIAGQLRSSVVVAAMVGMGLLVGFRPAAGPGGWLLALLVLSAYGLAMASVTVLLALLLRSVEAIESIGLSLLFPFTMLSSAFVPTATMPQPLRAISEVQPVNQVVLATRALLLGESPGYSGLLALGWTALIVAVCAPLAARAYRRATA